MNVRAELVTYRLARAKESLEDAQLLAEKARWNAAINRLYYAAFYGVSALLIHSQLNANTHAGARSQFSEHFIKTGIFAKNHGTLYSQLFSWRQKGDYDDLFDFTEEKVLPYFLPVEALLNSIEAHIQSA
jgi:uncharacterized protein (UPF0332 family)